MIYRSLCVGVWLVALLCLPTDAMAQRAPFSAFPSTVLPDPWGVNIHFTDPKPGEMEMLAAGGFRWIRMDFGWNGIEKEKGKYDFSAYDRLMAALDKQHVRALFILDYSNSNYDEGLSPHTDAGRQAFARWAAASAQHFKGRGILWEMYNEPNIGFWRPKPNVDDYAKLALEVGKALRQAAPTEVYIGPGSSTIDFKFLEACFKAGLLEYWSAVSVHPYRQSDPETVAPEYRHMRQLIAQCAPKGKHIPIIDSEWGYSSVWGSFTEEKQGRMLPRQWLTNVANDVILSIWYDWHDDGVDPKEPEHHFGTVLNPYHEGRDPVYDPKDSYRAAKALTAFVNGYTFNKRLAMNSPNDYVLLFAQGNNVRVAAWTTEHTQHQIEIPASPGRFTDTSHLGQPLPALTADGDGLTVTLSDAPQYLVPDQPNDLLRVAAAWQRAPLEIMATAPAEARLDLKFTNPLSHEFGGVRPHQTAISQTRARVMRSDAPLSFLVTCPGFANHQVAQEVPLIVTNPLHVTILPAAGGSLRVRVENPSGGAFRGSIELQNGLLKQPLSFAAGQAEQVLDFPFAAANGYRVAATVKDQKGQPALVMSPVEFRLVDDWSKYVAGVAPTGYTIRPDGDAKVASEQTLTVGASAAGPPMPGMGVFKITYRFDPGWKFLQVMPATDELRKIEGQPKALGLWVYGDGQGNIARMRFTDATGQTFQPGGEAITWKGWRYIQFPLSAAGAGFWGGGQDGVVHYPIHIDTLFLFDSANRLKQEGEVYISGPTLIY